MFFIWRSGRPKDLEIGKALHYNGAFCHLSFNRVSDEEFPLCAVAIFMRPCRKHIAFTVEFKRNVLMTVSVLSPDKETQRK